MSSASRFLRSRALQKDADPGLDREFLEIKRDALPPAADAGTPAAVGPAPGAGAASEAQGK